jgi:PUA domain protein
MRLLRNGMRPGIVEIDPAINVGESVCVVDKNHHKPLSVCEALFSGTDMQAMQKGKVLKNIHYVGDAMWKIS